MPDQSRRPMHTLAELMVVIYIALCVYMIVKR